MTGDLHLLDTLETTLSSHFLLKKLYSAVSFVSNNLLVLIDIKFCKFMPCFLVTNKLLQILVQLPNGLHILPLGFTNGNLTLSCSLGVDINKGLAHGIPSLGFCKGGNLTVQIIISMPVKSHCGTAA